MISVHDSHTSLIEGGDFCLGPGSPGPWRGLYASRCDLLISRLKRRRWSGQLRLKRWLYQRLLASVNTAFEEILQNLSGAWCEIIFWVRGNKTVEWALVGVGEEESEGWCLIKTNLCRLVRDWHRAWSRDLITINIHNESHCRLYKHNKAFFKGWLTCIWRILSYNQFSSTNWEGDYIPILMENWKTGVHKSAARHGSSLGLLEDRADN